MTVRFAGKGIADEDGGRKGCGKGNQGRGMTVKVAGLGN